MAGRSALEVSDPPALLLALPNINVSVLTLGQSRRTFSGFALLWSELHANFQIYILKFFLT